MKRIATSVATGALLLAACGGGNAVEATVNGHEIFTVDVEEMRFEMTDFDRAPAQFAALLGLLVEWTAIEDRIAEEEDFAPSEDEIETTIRTIVINTGIFELEPYLRQNNVSESFLRRLATHALIDEYLTETLTEPIEEATLEEAEQALADAPDDWFEVCVRHILVPTTAAADAVLDRLDAGEEFALVAADRSIDTGSGAVGGSLACTNPNGPNGYVPEFADATLTAPLGEVTGPVKSDFGVHILIVDSRTSFTAEEVQEALTAEREAVAREAALEEVSDWRIETLVTADVTVDESRGTWVTDPEPRLNPPAVLE